jgi:hypothetical protein
MKQGVFMKKNYLLTLFLCGTLIVSVNAQSTTGYENVAWGASVSEVLRAYPEMVLHEKAILAFDLHGDLRKDFSAIVICYMESNVKTQIQSRSFYFYQEKLFFVSVTYTPEVVSSQNLRAGLESIYGTFVDFSPQASRQPMGITMTLTGCFKRINEHQMIELDMLELKGILVGKRTVAMIRYKEPAIWEQVIHRE